ncbi:MAG: hypothetical protein NTU88_12390 [Armatimonadetes bacterium]|nr:hypothetical protein [Armatimonadota bacterium]
MDASGGSLLKLDWSTNGAVMGPVNGLPVDAPSMRLVNPSFYTRQFVGSKEYVDIAIDAKGIHTAHVPKSAGEPDVLSYASTDHIDIVSGQPYPRPFAPSYAQYLPNKNILVTNKATGVIYYVDINGVVQSAAFYGELFELKLDPPVNPTRYIRVPGSSIPDYANTKLTNPALLRQPLSAERLLY